MRSARVNPFSLTLLAATTAAQGPSVLTLQTSHHVMGHGLRIEQGTGLVRSEVRQGTFTFAPTGTMTGALDVWQVDGNGTTFLPSLPVGADYYVSPRGVLELDWDPTPAVDLIELQIDPTASVLHAARYEVDSEAFSMIAIEASSGQSAATLTGAYHVYSQFTLQNGAAGYDTATDYGIWTFDGQGTVIATATFNYWQSTGLVSSLPATATHPYTVAPDGAITIMGQPGAMSAAGDLFCVAFTPGAQNEVGLTIGVRVGASYGLNDVDGSYRMTSHAHVLSPAGPRSRTEVGQLDVNVASQAAALFAVTGQRVETTVQSTNSTPATWTGTGALAAGGVLTLTGGTTGPIELAFADHGRIAVGRTTQNHSSLYVAVRNCPPATAIGTATPGSGGIAPELGMRTFPTLGNANWRFAITAGLGAAPAGLAIGFGASATGLPIAGGLVWVDPALVVATPFVPLGGTAGVNGDGSVDVALPIPASTAYAGLTLVSQAFVLDPAAPGGVAMSRAFRVPFCE